MTLTRKQRIETTLKQKFAPEQLQVRDDSHRHAGHAGWNAAGETHMHIQIVSVEFVGKTRLARHRMVNEALAPFFAEGLHALSIDANAPEAK